MLNPSLQQAPTSHAIAMEIQTLKQDWLDKGEVLYTLTPPVVDKTLVNELTYTFLTTCGLPHSVAPFLSFDDVKENSLLTPSQAYKLDFYELNNYLMLGANGSGDPVCIDTINNNEIVYLNHDNYFERVFINTDIIKFSICLLKYNNFIRSLVVQESNVYSRRKFDNLELEILMDNLIQVDKSCLSDNSFWKPEIDYLLYERDND